MNVTHQRTYFHKLVLVYHVVFFNRDFSEHIQKHAKIYPEYSVPKSLQFAKHLYPNKTYRKPKDWGRVFK